MMVTPPSDENVMFVDKTLLVTSVASRLAGTHRLVCTPQLIENNKHEEKYEK